MSSNEEQIIREKKYYRDEIIKLIENCQNPYWLNLIWIYVKHLLGNRNK